MVDSASEVATVQAAKGGLRSAVCACCRPTLGEHCVNLQGQLAMISADQPAGSMSSCTKKGCDPWLHEGCWGVYANGG
jgi:hypothetical protein